MSLASHSKTGTVNNSDAVLKHRFSLRYTFDLKLPSIHFYLKFDQRRFGKRSSRFYFYNLYGTRGKILV